MIPGKIWNPIIVVIYPDKVLSEYYGADWRRAKYKHATTHVQTDVPLVELRAPWAKARPSEWPL